MGFQIESGGTNSDHAKVTTDGRLDVSSRSDTRIYYVSRDEKRAFTMCSTATVSGGDYLLYLQNDDADRDIVIHKIIVGCSSATDWQLWEVTGTAASGSALTPKNADLGSGRTASATARGDGAISGLTTVGNEIAMNRTVAGGSDILIDGDELRIPEGKAIAVEIGSGSSVAADAEVVFFYEAAS